MNDPTFSIIHVGAANPKSLRDGYMPRDISSPDHAAYLDILCMSNTVNIERIVNVGGEGWNFIDCEESTLAYHGEEIVFVVVRNATKHDEAIKFFSKVAENQANHRKTERVSKIWTSK